MPNPVLAAVLTVLLAAQLPTFEDFRRADRERRESGQFRTAQSLQLEHVESDLIVRTVNAKAGDPQVLWGAAELLTDWDAQRAMFESALQASGTNTAIALRFGCAAASQRKFETALPWLRYCQQRDPDNLAPWVAESWTMQQQGLPLALIKPPSSPTQFYDYGADAARARIALLEAAGYSPYSARRLGYKAAMSASQMARDLAKPPIDETIRPLLLSTGRAMQLRPTFLVTELLGQSVERNVLASRPDAMTNDVVQARVERLERRRDELTELTGTIGREVVEFAGESEMIHYFDDMLTLGEEEAMWRLGENARRRSVK